MVDFGKAEARYVRLTFTGGQKNGFGRGSCLEREGVRGIEEALPQQWLGLTAADWDGREWRNNEGNAGRCVCLERKVRRVLAV